MQNQTGYRRTSGAKAVAIDAREQLVQLRLLQLMAVILSAAFAWGLHLIFVH
ncbi:MAG TPA: hypothetical protein VGT44_16610 [Ktedonobacteraceae bacterium]|nr:hypothetical protein [Ktedonobacteraceae bacterium]